MFARSIHWFRRDLRLADNTALRRASEQSGSVVPVYLLSDWSERHLWTGPARQEFLCGCLASLEPKLQTIGGRLIYRRGAAIDALRVLIRDTGAEAVFFNHDPDPFGRQREAELAAMCAGLGVACHGCDDVALHQPGEILKPGGQPYRVFTPYFRRWAAAEKRVPVFPPRDLATPRSIPSLPRPSLATWKLPPHRVKLFPAGEDAAQRRLRSASVMRLPLYAERRDFPADQSTSRLSQDLRWGTISARKVYRKARSSLAAASDPSTREGIAGFLRQLAWRDFYMQILAHFPEVLEVEFNPDYRGLPWDEPGEQFERWKRGETGFPIVDAGMRELAATGFMHNRVRMIVAMFLTKDLHLDWRLGEQFFMQSLVDGEIASNNGGWQWSAGTGADAAPYFRIQNPWTQTKRYDPEGRYIRRWVPELAEAPDHALFTAPRGRGSVHPGYPPPLVDHAAERVRTLDIFKRHAAQRGR